MGEDLLGVLPLVGAHVEDQIHTMRGQEVLEADVV